jgi:hypothetical protein
MHSRINYKLVKIWAGVGGDQSVILALLVGSILCIFFLLPFLMIYSRTRSSETKWRTVRKYSAGSFLESSRYCKITLYLLFYIRIVVLGPGLESVTSAQCLRRKSCYRFLSPLKICCSWPGLNPQTFGPVASMITSRLSRMTWVNLMLIHVIDWNITPFDLTNAKLFLGVCVMHT